MKGTKEANPRKFVMEGIVVALVVAIVILTAFLVDSNRKISNVKNECAETIFSALQSISLNLPRYETIDEPGVLGVIPGALMRVDAAMRIAEGFSDDDIGIPEGSGFDLLSTIFGGKLSREINGVSIESLLFDGKLSENEHEFMEKFAAAVDELVSEMTDNGQTLKAGYSYSKMRDSLKSFVEYWTNTDFSTETPLSLLSVD